MNYSFEFNKAGYPVCKVEEPFALFGQFLSFEIVPTRIKELTNGIVQAKSKGLNEIEIERDDAVLTFINGDKVELDIWTEGGGNGESIEILFSDFELLVKDWKVFLEHEWEGCGT